MNRIQLCKTQRFLRSFILGGLVLCLVTACQGLISKSPTPPNQLNSSSSCRIIQHSMGETCVPLEPQRVVVLGVLDYALSLGIKPIGSDEINDREVHLNGEIDGIEDVGRNNAPNLEKILSLKPDLILGGDYINVDYKILSNIAPTVLFSFEHSGKWKEFFMHCAEVFGKTTEAKQVMNNYYARLEKFKQQMGNRAAQIAVSIVRVYPTHVNLYLKDSFCGTIVADAGLSRPPSQDYTATEAEA